MVSFKALSGPKTSPRARICLYEVLYCSKHGNMEAGNMVLTVAEPLKLVPGCSTPCTASLPVALFGRILECTCISIEEHLHAGRTDAQSSFLPTKELGYAKRAPKPQIH